MKWIFYVFALIAVCLVVGCGGKKTDSPKEERQIFQIDSVDEHTGVQRMQVSHISQTVDYKGKKFKVLIDRIPDDALPVVKSDMGTFADNRVSVKIMRENGALFFSKTFTKNDFASYLPAEYLLHSVLEGVVFDDEKTLNNKKLTLAASVSYPMTDLYVPFTLVVSQNGNFSITKDEDMGELTPLEEE